MNPATFICLSSRPLSALACGDDEPKDKFQIYLDLCAGDGRSFGVGVLVLSPCGTFL